MHGYYWNDDQPMMYFQDVRDRPRYCASHIAPLEELTSDLANPAARYTHYSLPRTIEAAMGLGTLTANDRYAQPLNSIFNSERTSFSAPSPVNVATRKAGPVAAAITG